MGTSQSSKGASSGTPLVPPWTPDASPAQDQTTPTTPEPNGAPPVQPEQRPEISPRGRFNGARRNISDYAQTGSRESLSRGLGHYAKKGLGGSKNAAKRLGGTSVSAGSLYHALSSLASQVEGQPSTDKLDKNELLNRPRREVIDHIVNALAPTNGTLDSEARQRSMDNALSKLYEEFNDVDICNLSDEQVIFAVETFAIEDVIRRFELDLGQSIIENAPNSIEGAKRFKEAQDYIREVAKDAFKSLKDSGNVMNTATVNKIVNEAIETTFDVFIIEGNI